MVWNMIYDAHALGNGTLPSATPEQLWSRLEHPNITPFYGICFDLGPPSAPCLIYPYFKNGNVAKYLEKNSNVNRVKLLRFLCSQTNKV